MSIHFKNSPVQYRIRPELAPHVLTGAYQPEKAEVMRRVAAMAVGSDVIGRGADKAVCSNVVVAKFDPCNPEELSSFVRSMLCLDQRRCDLQLQKGDTEVDPLKTVDEIETQMASDAVLNGELLVIVGYEGDLDPFWNRVNQIITTEVE